MSFKRGDLHPSKPGWRFLQYRKAKQGGVVEVWSSPEAWDRGNALRRARVAAAYPKNREKILERMRRYRAANPAKVREHGRRFHADNSLRRLYAHKKALCKMEGIPFTLSFEFFEKIPSVCPILGIPIQRNKRIADNSPSLDRLEGRLGYIPGNVRWISNRANRIKSDATPEELRAIAAFVSNKTNYS